MRKDGKAQGQVYLVSVTGPKMHAVNDRARTQPDGTAEATDLHPWSMSPAIGCGSAPALRPGSSMLALTSTAVAMRIISPTSTNP
jgi:hypothetical protein